MKTLRAALCAMLVVVLAAPAFAAPPQPVRKPDVKKDDGGKNDGKKDEAAKDEAAPDEPMAQYEPPMLRLAETLGALTFLRDLCGAGDGSFWRERMQALLDAEGQIQARRARLAGAFNRGFQDYALVYRMCTPNAELALSRRLAEGRKLSRDLAARWGD